MKLTPPKQGTWWISLLLGILGLVITFTTGSLSVYGLWLVVLGWLLLVLGTLLKGL